jgi:putative hydrolase of the HAD superfamily
MLRWPVVVFDLDDTLYPEHQYVMSGFQAVSAYLEDRGLARANKVSDCLHSLFRRGIRGNTFDTMLKQLGLENRIEVNELIDHYRAHKPTLKLHPWVQPLVEALKGEGAILGLISDGYLQAQRAKWQALPLAAHFTHVLFSDSLGREHWKPSTKPFLQMIDVTSCAPKDVVYIGDNPLKDFKGPNDLGMPSIHLKIDGGIHCDEKPKNSSYRATFETRSPEIDLPTLLLMEDLSPV